MTSKSPDDTLMKTAESTDSIVNLTDSSTQTDEELIYNYAWKSKQIDLYLAFVFAFLKLFFVYFSKNSIIILISM